MLNNISVRYCSRVADKNRYLLPVQVAFNLNKYVMYHKMDYKIQDIAKEPFLYIFIIYFNSSEASEHHILT